jgi:FkbM family methyltransferase
MISYAQNAEDVVLRRAFADVDLGFYVDVGASSPTDDSVTRHFYERGWRGVNVEPDFADFEELVAARPRDVNLNAAVGSSTGQLRFQAGHVRGHGTVSEDGDGVQIEQLSLEEIFDRFVPENGVEFLKVDVEGWEGPVLASANWKRTRPKIVVVEAVDPDGKPSHGAWEPRLIEAGYQFALFDGLNRFYCRGEDAGRLLPRLGSPANVRDMWRDAREVRIQERLQAEAATAAETDGLLASAEARLAEVETRLAEAEAETARQRAAHTETMAALAGTRDALAAERERCEQILAELAAVRASTSWRATSPARDMSRFVKLLRR